MIKKNKIPTILGIVLLVAGVFAGVFFLNVRQFFKLGATATAQPKNVRISNVSDVEATVSWTTDAKTSAFLAFGRSEGNLSQIENESATNEKFFTHSVTLSGLKPGASYFFKINSEGSMYDNNGVPWQITSGQTLGLNPNSQIISGSVINPSGQPVERALVYITVGGYLTSTITSSTGNFVYQLGNVRTPDLQSYAQIDPSTTLLEISVDAGPDGISSAQIFPQSANPIPAMILGEIYDLRKLPPSSNNQLPNANLNLPQNATPESKFDTSGATTSGTPTKSVILESITEGETVTSTEPEFFGKGPAGETITITVHSDQAITRSVTIPSNGSWSWAVPSNLSPGAHTITIAWKDAAGITRTLTRGFVVQASELPAFVATPSQTLAPSASPTSTPRPTLTPRATATASAAPVPVTGDSTSTILLYIMGVVIIAFSFIVYKNAESI